MKILFWVLLQHNPQTNSYNHHLILFPVLWARNSGRAPRGQVAVLLQGETGEAAVIKGWPVRSRRPTDESLGSSAGVVNRALPSAWPPQDSKTSYVVDGIRHSSCPRRTGQKPFPT